MCQKRHRGILLETFEGFDMFFLSCQYEFALILMESNISFPFTETAMFKPAMLSPDANQ